MNTRFWHVTIVEREQANTKVILALQIMSDGASYALEEAEREMQGRNSIEKISA